MSSILLPEPATADRVDWHLAPQFMLRVGGLPFGFADRIAAPDSTAWADEVIDAELRLRDAGARLADLLQESVSQHLDDEDARRALINLRRDVFNLRAPRGLEAAERLLSAERLALLHAWLAERERHGELLAAGSRIVAEETRYRREELRLIARTTDLRYGIQLSSPSLDEHLDLYLDWSGGPLSKRARRIERSLLEYLFRTACKTSPFSTLTSVCLGRFGESPGGPLHAEAGDWGKRSATRLNMAVLARLSALMSTTAAVRRDLPVRATGGLEVHRDRVRYLRRLQNASGNEDAAVTLDTVSESLFYVPTGEVLADTLDLLSGDTPVRFGDAVRQLCAMRPDRAEEDVEEYLAQLLRLGLLVVPDLQLDIHDPDPVRSYRKGLLGLGCDWADEVAGLIERMDSDVAEFAGAGLDRRRDLLAGIRASATRAHERLGGDDVPVVRTLVYEDTTVPAAEVTGDARTWTDQLSPALRQLARILPAFDTNLVRRFVTKGYFTVRYGVGGRCTDFLSFAHEFDQDLYDNYSQRLMRHQRFEGTELQPFDNWFRQGEITGIDEARATVAREITRRRRDSATTGTDVELDEEFIRTVADRLPRKLGSLQPLSFFLQVADGGSGAPSVVVNRVYSGLTLLFSRFAHLFGPELPGELGETLQAVVPEGAVFAELKGGYDATNLNLHPVVTPYEIVCPGETSFRPQQEQIPVDDLVIEHCQESDRLLLRSRRLGVEVIPVYLGFLMPMALPEVQQVLLNFSYTGLAQLDLWEGTDLPDEEVVALPRIRLGNVVVQRRSWRIAASRLPIQEKSSGDHEWFLSWRRWQRSHGLPRRVFANLGKEHKPQYVDFDSYFSLQLLDAAARKTEGRVVLTEMLPGPEELWLKDGDQQYVTELTVELDGTRTEQ
ncbi:lantibiotic dehydratase [Streptomyces sp. TP-A0874]|uniref:lantibiotic dehydratase n=1 Tax=Streptomyces sp. TP-A0874 TaxID=549819 RepID=UPI0008536484|nr:lantibiotic dehydratase [Streptomyces sp. TP-A0874]